MKRDARIGLAVVLVLGLAVTLLIGRALYRNTDVADAPGDDGVETSTAAAGEDVRRVDGVREASAATPFTQPDATDTSRAETVDLPHDTQNTAVQAFVQDQTRPLGGNDRLAGSPGMTLDSTAGRPGVTAGNGARPTPTNGGPEDFHDHEETAPVKPEAIPTEYGYVVAAGDNVWKISGKVYGDGKYTQKIVDANKDLNMSKLKPGMVIKIPTIQNKTVLLKLPSFADAKSGKSNNDTAVAARETKSAESRPLAAQKLVKMDSAANELAAAPATHKVESGETLGSIANKYYGASGPKTIARIVEANKGLNPAKLKVGQEIVLPAKK